MTHPDQSAPFGRAGPRARLGVLLALLSLASPAAAQIFTGPRAAGMGETNFGMPAGNDALFTNPAGLALYPRYAIEFFWRRQTERNGNLFSISVVDSKSGSVAGGIAYDWESVGRGGSLRRGSRVDMGSAYAVAPFMLMGATLRWVAMETAEGPVNRVTGDSGMIIVLADGIFLGFSAHNVVNPVEETAAAPRTLGGGLSVSALGNLALAVDYRRSFDDASVPTSWHFGAEYFAFRAFPLRAGYVIDGLLDQRRWTVGLGYVDPTFGVDLAWSRTLGGGESDQHLVLGVRLFL